MATPKHTGTPAPATTSTRKPRIPSVTSTSTPRRPPTSPQQIPLEHRRKPHYVLIVDDVNGRYVHDDLTHPTLTETIWDAFVTDSFHFARNIANTANAKDPSFRKLGQLGTISVQLAEVTHNGFIVGAEPFVAPESQLPGGPTITLEPLHRFHGSRVNTALAQAADVEDTFADTVVCIHTLLSFSPMFVALVNDYHHQVANPDGIEPDWYLCQMASRLFYAGVCAGRREAGQRTKEGQLLMDAADFDYKRTDHLTITPLHPPEPEPRTGARE